MQEPKVNVAILSESEVEFVLYGDYHCQNYDDLFSGNVKAVYGEGKIQLITDNISFDPVNEILLTPSGSTSDTFLLKNVTIGLQFHWEQKQNQRFTGALK